MAPRYPSLASRARVEGVVFLNVMVDETGNVADVQVVRGHQLLFQAAVEAVRQWKFSPTLLGGEPIRVMATISVVFRLGYGDAASSN